MPDNKKVKVLLVDDEEAFVETLSARLGGRGITAATALGGREALEFIDRDEPDVMILDLKMPGMDGLEVLRRVRKSHPHVQTIILSGYDSAANKKAAAELGALDFLGKPADMESLTAKIRTVFAAQQSHNPLYSYGDFVPLLQQHLADEEITLGENGLGIKCFCRDDNQDQLGFLLMSIGRSPGWFDLNSFGAYPAGRSIESFGPPSRHIPQRQDNPWTVIFHATHVGCDSRFTLGLTERYNMLQPSSSCGLLAAILDRHDGRRQGKEPPAFKDFEMTETEKALLPHLDEITDAVHPMAAAAEKLFELGAVIFDSLLRECGGRHFYIGGINVDYDAVRPENNLFVPKTLSIYKAGTKRELTL